MLKVPTAIKKMKKHQKSTKIIQILIKKSTKTLTPIIHINIRKKINYQNQPHPHQIAKTNKTPDKTAQFHEKMLN